MRGGRRFRESTRRLRLRGVQGGRRAQPESSDCSGRGTRDRLHGRKYTSGGESNRGRRSDVGVVHPQTDKPPRHQVVDELIAHENNKKEQQTALAAGGRGTPPADKLPNQITTKAKEATTIDGVKLELYHWAPAHTSGDLVVYLPDQKICSTGDLIVTNRADDNPNIHFEKNGSTEGWLTNVKGMIGLNAETYVTGHGDLLTKADLQRKLDATAARRAKVAAMIKEGKSLDEIKTALPDAPAPGAPARGAAVPAGAAAGGAARGGGAPAGPAPKTWVESAYAELTAKK